MCWLFTILEMCLNLDKGILDSFKLGFSAGVCIKGKRQYLVLNKSTSKEEKITRIFALCLGILQLNSRVIMIAGARQHVPFMKHTWTLVF